MGNDYMAPALPVSGIPVIEKAGMVITKSKTCTQCAGKVRLMPSDNLPVDGQTRTVQTKICPECGQKYVRSRQDLAFLGVPAR